MKQITECLDRAFQNKRPLKKKWVAFLEWQQDVQRPYLYLYHYHHLILIYDPISYYSLYEWHEKKSDYRGLLAAKKYLNERHYNDKVPSK
ncbi:hypothetical protein [Virgibacillus salexigens]|uniref:Uncharacterized protein n=1 Tax=Virgibacillus massiliensis TaxID=1462526 RepID=A0A024QI85_9BACI|nr:hypothetical protein [Virgibacillus massiliensis]CDQ41937.1 hypothetical protein BN990_04316 [Virgibacillus massiliensis]